MSYIQIYPQGKKLNNEAYMMPWRSDATCYNFIEPEVFVPDFPSLEEVALLAQCVCVLQGREGFNLVGKEGVALDPGPNTPRRPVGEGVAAAIVTPHMSTS